MTSVSDSAAHIRECQDNNQVISGVGASSLVVQPSARGRRAIDMRARELTHVIILVIIRVLLPVNPALVLKTWLVDAQRHVLCVGRKLLMERPKHCSVRDSVN